MRSMLRHGRIPAPASVAAARVRRDQLLAEVEGIDAQLADPVRSTLPRYTEPGSYDEWRASAERARRQFVREARLLAEWVDRSDDALLRDLHALLGVLGEEGVELVDGEAVVARRLAERLGVQEAVRRSA